jgi:hypothetical protein
MREMFQHNGKDFYLVLIERDDIDEVWPFVSQGVHKAITHSDSTMDGDDFLEPLNSGQARLWVFMSEAKVVGHVITEIIRYPRKSLVRMLTMECKGGENGMVGMDLWSKFVPIVEEYAAENGCEHLEAYTRRGMVRSLEKHGWENQFNILTKSVDQMRLH